MREFPASQLLDLVKKMRDNQGLEIIAL